MPALTPRLIDHYNAAQLAELPDLLVSDTGPFEMPEPERPAVPTTGQLVIPGMEPPALDDR